jgi:hypothetical protein
VYLIVIGWMYVVLMMSVAEATNTTGSLLGAIVTFFLYGILPLSILVYLMRSPSRRKAIKAREAAEDAARAETQHGGEIDPAPGRPKPDQPPRGAATREAAEPRHSAEGDVTQGGSIHPDAGGHAPAAAQADSVAPVRKEP